MVDAVSSFAMLFEWDRRAKRAKYICCALRGAHTMTRWMDPLCLCGPDKNSLIWSEQTETRKRTRMIWSHDWLVRRHFYDHYGCCDDRSHHRWSVSGVRNLCWCVADGVINKLISQQSMPSPSSSSCICIQLLSYRASINLTAWRGFFCVCLLHLRFRLAFCRFVVLVFGVGGRFWWRCKGVRIYRQRPIWPKFCNVVYPVLINSMARESGQLVYYIIGGFCACTSLYQFACYDG